MSTIEKHVCLHFFTFFDVLFQSNLLAGKKTHTERGWTPISKPRLDYKIKSSVPKTGTCVFMRVYLEIISPQHSP